MLAQSDRMINNKIVSSEDELLIVVDNDNNSIDYKNKAECHTGNGILHRAFSIFIFNEQNQLLMQKRSKDKLLWPMYWSNSCCSHPRRNEDNEEATQRRLNEELGFKSPLKYLYTFQYHATFRDIGSENESCAVYIGKTNGSVSANPNEIDEWKFVDLPELDKDIAKNPNHFTPWFIIEWNRIRKEYIIDIENISQGP